VAVRSAHLADEAAGRRLTLEVVLVRLDQRLGHVVVECEHDDIVRL
jgi:hypothetical protein